MNIQSVDDIQYAKAMGNLLVLYTQVDQFIMETCAERIASAPSLRAKMGLAKQVGDECRHVSIQHQWMREFGVDQAPVIDHEAISELHQHFLGTGFRRCFNVACSELFAQKLECCFRRET